MSEYYFPDYEKRAIMVIGQLIEHGKKDFIIYPFGEQGKLAKCILNVYFGIQEVMIVDNILKNSYPAIKSCSELSNLDLTDKTILIASDRLDIFDEIRGGYSLMCLGKSA